MLKITIALMFAIALTSCASTNVAATSSSSTLQDQNVTVARKLYADFMKGDINSVLGAMSDNVVWEIAGPSNVPYAGVRRGKKEWMDYLSGLGAVEVLAFEPTEFLADKDKVVVLGTERLKVKANGNIIDEKFAQVITFANGQVVHFRSYDDSASSAAAFRSAP